MKIKKLTNIIDKILLDSPVKPSASPRGEPQNDKFKAFRNRLIKSKNDKWKTFNNSLIIVILLFSFIKAEKAYAFLPPDKYLWIEYKECIKEKDGGVTLPLQINYGKFPNQKKNIPNFDNLRAFYTLAKENDKKNWIFHETQIEKNGGKTQIKIKSAATNNFIVFVEAKI
ncbi:MAG: hypothetical protein ABIH18_06545, partial [Candidatus Omnitrophota bacterium]